jgi:hypothetical protein
MRGRVPVVPRFQSQHDEPTDSRLLSGSRCVVSRTVVFSILYRSITPDVILSRSFYTGEISRVDGEMRCQRRRTPRRTDRLARLPPVSKT